MELSEITSQGIQEPGVKQERGSEENETEMIHQQNKHISDDEGNISMEEIKYEVMTDDDNDNTQLPDNTECHNTQVLSKSECINAYDDMIDIKDETQILDVKCDMSEMLHNVGSRTAPSTLNIESNPASSDEDIPLKRLRSRKRVKRDEDTGLEDITELPEGHAIETPLHAKRRRTWQTLARLSRSRSVTPSDSAAERARGRPSAARRALLLGLVAEAEPREIEVPPPSPHRPKTEALSIVQTPGGSLHVTGERVAVETTPSGTHVRRVAEDVPLCSNVYERVEAMDVEEEEAEEILSSAPWHVRRWMTGLPSEISISVPPTNEPTASTSANPDSAHVKDTSVNYVGSSNVVADVVVPTDIDARPSTSGLTSTSRQARRLQDAGSDFDSDFDDEFDVGATEGIARDIPDDEELDEPLRNIIQEMERGMDDAIDRRLGVSASFNWVQDFGSFTGVPEEFSGPRPGPVKDYDSPFDAFTDIFDKDIMEKIVLETNRYAKQTIDDLKARGLLKRSSRLNRWRDTNVEEMMVFFGVLMYMGIDSRTSVTEYWTTNVLEMPAFKSLLSYNRYVLLNKFLHFVDNSDLSQNCPQNEEMCSGDRAMHARVWKLSPLLKHLQEKFKSLYNLKQSVAIDESLLLFKGRLSWAQTIRSKAARFGIKSYELCESVTGYMAGFQIYTGKSSDGTHTDASLSADLGGKSTKVVLELLKGLERRGHRVTMDNFYNCPSLARYLKSQGFDCLGTLRPNRRHVPEEIAKVPKNVAKGTIIARHSGDVSIVAWKDSKVVTVISTYHDDGTCVGTKAGQTIVKPKCVNDYNSTMGGVDLKDQKLAMYLLERKRCVKWYVKIFKRLLNVSIHNAYIMYTESLRRRNKLPVTHREFRYALAESLVKQVTRSEPMIRQGSAEITRLRRDICHIPKYLSGDQNRRSCIVCRQENKRKVVHSQCTTCDVFLCFENCWEVWHTTDNFEIKKRGRKRTRDE